MVLSASDRREVHSRIRRFEILAQTCQTEFERIASEVLSFAVRLPAFSKHTLCFLNLQVLADRHHVPFREVVEIFLEHFSGNRSRNRKTGIGVPLRTLLSSKAIEHVDEKLRKKYEDSSQVWKSRMRLPQLLTRMEAGSSEMLDPQTYISSYLARMKNIRITIRNAETQAKIRPYRGNPWV